MASQKIVFDPSPMPSAKKYITERMNRLGPNWYTKWLTLRESYKQKKMVESKTNSLALKDSLMCWRESAIEIEKQAKAEAGVVSEKEEDAEEDDVKSEIQISGLSFLLSSGEDVNENKIDLPNETLPDIPLSLLKDVSKQKPNKSRALMWTMSHLHGNGVTYKKAFDDLDPATAAMAYAFLKFARSSMDTARDFMKNIIPRVLMGRTDLEADGKFDDDGREIIGIIEKIRQARQSAILRSRS